MKLPAQDFAEKYDEMLDLYEDPIETVFAVMTTSLDPQIKLQAAGMLLSHRYAKPKSLEVNFNSGKQVTLNLHLASGATQEIDITPTPLQVAESVADELVGRAA